MMEGRSLWLHLHLSWHHPICVTGSIWLLQMRNAHGFGPDLSFPLKSAIILQPVHKCGAVKDNLKVSMVYQRGESTAKCVHVRHRLQGAS